MKNLLSYLVVFVIMSSEVFGQNNNPPSIDSIAVNTSRPFHIVVQEYQQQFVQAYADDTSEGGKLNSLGRQIEFTRNRVCSECRYHGCQFYY